MVENTGQLSPDDGKSRGLETIHLGGSLVEGVLEGNVVTCPRHGSRFDVKTGKAVGKAKIAFIKIMPRDEKSYAVKVEGTDIMLETGGG